ncbi:hypothetical protein DCAR_0415961 [Daucus carota subsp. sativus]|uniref:RNA helicase n=1 Tax=Daucus carota subsp. sativus TaxID=79200 RepID=A0AAF0WZ58_DAUCS|nr:PREDICTED: DEAD-box ATP-dependent RNA helicase 52C-like [Daucus carota subsp. sativus]WOG96625.1 hypothetical protein DCAR_0415961 [Daucus carota subsp. sativus]
MYATDSYSHTRRTRPSRSTYLPPHLRNTNTHPTFSDPNSYASDSQTHRFPPSRGRGTPRGRGSGRGRGRGRSYAPRNRPAFHPNPDPNPFDVIEKFDDLEILSDSDEKSGINYEVYDDIPVEASGSDIPEPANSFNEIDLGKGLNDNIRRCKYVKPTPVQRYAIPVVMAGRDLMACAQTGSGKTAAFCFPIISGILKHHNVGSGSPVNHSGVASPIALILSPTRELSCQIHEEARKFSYETGIKVAVAYGGTPITHQLHKLEKGVDILVATPGRLLDMIERAKLSLKKIKYLALDEADRMLDMGFERQIRKVVEQMGMPPPGVRQTMLFSATFPNEIQRLATDFLSNYIFLTVGKVGSSTELIAQRVEYVQDMDKRDRLMNLLVEQSANENNGKRALTLIFVETKRGADSMESWLCRNGFLATAIHGDKAQMERERALRSFKTGVRPILVATDVAARGLDVPHVTHVINYDLPKDIDDYVHRIGRTGRAGKSGLATAFFCDKNSHLAKSLVQLMQEAKQQVPPWLTQYAETSSSYGGARAYRPGGSKFGGHDFRKATNMSGGNHYYSSGYTNQVAFGEPCIAPSGPFNSFYSGEPAYPVASVDSYAAGAYGYPYNHGSLVAGTWN